MKHLCLICGEKHHQLLFSVKDFFSVHHYAVAECQGCSFAETVIPDGKEGVRQVYGAAESRFGKLQPLSKKLYALRTKSIASRPGRLLDIGAGHGEFLEAMRAQGWQGEGVEWEHQEKFLSGQFAEVDLVTFWHSLEHLTDPRAYLKAAFSALKPGGTLLIEVPNFQSFQSWWAEKNWLHLDCPRHRYHFSLNALKRLVLEAGFHVQSVSTFSWDVGLFGNLQAWLDHFGKPHFLYDFLQPDRRQNLSSAAIALNLALGTFLLPFVAPLAFVSEVVASCFRRGGVIRLVGMKA